MLTQPTLATLPTEPSARLGPAPAAIGRFQIRGEIGRGSNGVVYAAHDPVLGREVAIKAIPLTDDEHYRRQIEANFLNEAKAAAGVNHPNIITVFDAGKQDQLAYIAMERLHGRDLHDFMASGQRLGYRQIASLMARVADAVHYAHKRGLVHRDIKPSNIFLLRDGKPKVLDFGVAMAVANDPNATHRRQLIGTPNYMSPEQALGRKLDARSDVFSIGTILYELIAGRRAFEGRSIEDTLAQVISDTPVSLAELRPDVPAALREIVERSLDKDVEARFQTAGELRNALVAFAEPGTVSAYGPRTGARSSLRRGWFEPASSPLAIIAASAAVIAAAILVYFATVKPKATPPPPVESGAPQAPAAPQRAAQEAPSDAAREPVAESRADAEAALARSRQAESRRPVRAETSPAPAPVGNGVVTLGIAPWGEVLVDGVSRGVSPPLTRIELPPGSYSIEVRNNAAQPYRARVEIKPGQSVSLQHRF